MSPGASTMCRSVIEMNGKLPSIQTVDSSNCISCSLASGNSHATFQTMMNNIFQGMIAEGVVCVYLDDILIFTKMLSEHWNIVQKVLESLWEYKLYLKLEKCEFEWKWIEFLGVIVLEGWVEMDPVKVSGIAEWPVPQNKKEVQFFVGFINFY